MRNMNNSKTREKKKKRACVHLLEKKTTNMSLNNYMCKF